ncbi:MAG: hypothetical protein WAT39_18650 [Planctomycetota bacterium]
MTVGRPLVRSQVEAFADPVAGGDELLRPSGRRHVHDQPRRIEQPGAQAQQVEDDQAVAERHRRPQADGGPAERRRAEAQRVVHFAVGNAAGAGAVGDRLRRAAHGEPGAFRRRDRQHPGLCAGVDAQPHRRAVQRAVDAEPGVHRHAVGDDPIHGAGREPSGDGARTQPRTDRVSVHVVQSTAAAGARLARDLLARRAADRWSDE